MDANTNPKKPKTLKMIFLEPGLMNETVIYKGFQGSQGLCSRPS